MLPLRPDQPRCAAVVLAGGASTRLGQPKQLLTLHGESLLRRTIRLAQEAGFDPICVVVGAHAGLMQAEIADLVVTIVENPNWRSGMGSSLRAGVMAAVHPEVPDHLLLLVCDQPALNAALLRGMREQHLTAGTPITAARYSGRMGVPAILARRFFPELLNVPGDQGARSILERHVAEALSIPFEEGAYDIDVPQDMQHLTARAPSRE